VSEDKAQQYVLLLCHKEQWSQALDALKPYSFSSARFKGLTGTAKSNIAAIDAELEQNAREQEQQLEAIRAHAECKGELELISDRMAQDAAKEHARERGMTDGTIVFLEGWAPAEKVDKVESVIKNFDAAYSFADPKEYETPPTLLENPWWMRPINMVTEMYSLPAYDSLDPNPLMFPFFVLFYGIMMADMGYGLVMMLVSWLVIKKYHPKGTAGHLFGLLGICGIPTFIFGALTGGFFGDFIPQLLKLINPSSTFELPSLFTPLNDTLMILVGSMILGAIQVITGMAINFYKLTKRGQFWDAVMDVGSWWLVFIGVGVGVATGVWAVAIAGVAALILTQGRSAPTLIGKLVGGVSSLYDITGYFGDILSYSRLMALMLAGSVIAQVFNTLGAIPGNVIFFIVISLAGNTLNFALNILGCYVHDLRLQCLEYFNKFYEDGGRPFAPLAYNTKYVDVEQQ
jgi:V/A-type H+-transporting ATPase subunit I